MTRMRVAALAAAVMVAVMAVWGPTAEAAGRHRMSFTPGDRGRPSLHHRAGRSAGHRAFRGRHAVHGHRAVRGHHASGHRAETHRVETHRETENAAKAVPGAGFKLEDGVLTYPAPARFQPKNLPHH
jgi:hypothetical protein